MTPAGDQPAAIEALSQGLVQGKKPRFVKDFMAEAQSIEGAVKNYVEAVKNGRFPGPEHCY